MDKILDLLTGFVALICIAILTFFTIMCIMLYRFKECKENDFESAYCESYKDF